MNFFKEIMSYNFYLFIFSMEYPNILFSSFRPRSSCYGGSSQLGILKNQVQECTRLEIVCCKPVTLFFQFLFWMKIFWSFGSLGWFFPKKSGNVRFGNLPDLKLTTHVRLDPKKIDKSSVGRFIVIRPITCTYLAKTCRDMYLRREM